LELFDELNIDIKIIYYGEDQSVNHYVSTAILPDGRINNIPLRISLLQEPWRDPLRGGKPHGDVVIIDRITSESDSWWGGTSFEYGTCFIYVPRERQKNIRFIRNVAKHEATHMLGYHLHHEDVHAHVPGYPLVVDCLAFHRCSSTNICSKCKDAILSFWIGVQKRTGRNYFKFTRRLN
jgi:hypothetical protein